VSHGPDSGLGTIGNSKLHEDVVDVALDRVAAQTEQLSDAGVVHPLRDKRQDPDLLRRQVGYLGVRALG